MAEMHFVDLTVDNLFDACTLLDVIGTEEILAAFNTSEITAMSKAGKDAQGIGLYVAMKAAGIVIRNLPKAKAETCAFLAGCCIWDDGTPVTADDIRKMKIGPFARLIKDFFRQGDLADFFGELVGSLGMAQSNSAN